MNKAELIDAIASESNLTKADAKRALDAFIATTTGALKRAMPVIPEAGMIPWHGEIAQEAGSRSCTWMLFYP